MKEIDRLRVIHQVIKKELKAREAAEQLRISVRASEAVERRRLAKEDTEQLSMDCVVGGQTTGYPKG